MALRHGMCLPWYRRAVIRQRSIERRGCGPEVSLRCGNKDTPLRLPGDGAVYSSNRHF
jgi:hypothetical protein